MSNYNPNEKKRPSLDEIEEMEQKEKRASAAKGTGKFNLFSRRNDDPLGVPDNEKPISEDPSLINFFKLLGRKMNQFLTVNLMMLVGNFPIFFLLLEIAGFFSTSLTTPAHYVSAPLYGAALFSNSAPLSALWTVFSSHTSIRLLSLPDYILLALSALLFITFGPVRVGATYIIRNMFRGEPVFMKHDFFYAIKRNLMQSIIYGIIDLAISGILFYNIWFYIINFGLSTMMNIMLYMTIGLILIYFTMRHYIYLMLVTFDLSIFKMFKNALIFTVLGLKRNIMVLFGTIVLLALEYVLMAVFVPLATIVPFIFFPSLLILMGVYAAYPKIKDIMIDPYYEEIKNKQPDQKNTEQ